MKSLFFYLILIVTVFSFGFQLLHSTEQMLKIQAGQYVPFYQQQKKMSVIVVPSFFMDKYAVTNQEYLQFVFSNPQWRRSKVKRLLADTNYLAYWKNDTNIGTNYFQLKNSPVTNISWFAANAFAKWKNKRLPTTAEWEYAASATLDSVKGSNDKTALTKIILQWYEKPPPPTLPNVGSTFKNKYGLYDMHGLVWEWVFDFNNRVASNDSRSGNNVNSDLFCSDGNLKTLSKEDYATYMRFSFRFSLKGNYCIKSLGFRCAKSINNNEK